jgi:NADPH:quinone reductase
MRAVTIPRFGEAAVLALEDVPTPAPGPDQVAIDVTHAAVGLADVLMRRGELGGIPPIIPGLEVAGTIRGVGDRAAGLRVGQPVVTLSRPSAGGYAEVTLADAAITFPLDDVSPAVDPGLAVAVVPNATTALLALEEVAHLRTGERVLVHGATGALASIVGQVARELGAGRVIGTVRSPDRVEDAERNGFDIVVESADFADELAQRDLDAIDVIVDPVGGPLRAESLKVLAPLGRLLAVGNASGTEDVRIGANELWLSTAGVLGFNVGGLLASKPERGSAAARRALALVAAGRVATRHTTLPLDRAGEAHRRLEAGGLSGRLVLTAGASRQPQKERRQMGNTIIERFFDELGAGNDEAVLQLVTPDATFEAQGPPRVPIYGHFEGHEGVRRFIATLRELFDTEWFDVRQSTERDGLAFAYGYMQHRVRSTGRVFRSEWALYCEVREGRIRSYKMFEDTAALAAAYGRRD